MDVKTSDVGVLVGLFLLERWEFVNMECIWARGRGMVVAGKVKAWFIYRGMCV